MALAEQLLDWYYKNARDLPWRKDKNAYKVWVSEIMLQQTRVEAVKAYYHRWMERFPTLETLAQASEQEVLTYWQGLGYYSRARNLLAGVREVCANYRGKVPQNTAEIQKLPGIGDYTAGAIASISYNQPTPAIDGNVLRIFSRLFCLDEDILKQSTKRKIERLVRSHIPSDSPGDFNQALMDLGAMICIPRNPRCHLCPLLNLCEAYAREVQDVLPVRAAKKTQRLILLAAGLITKDDRYLIRQRPARGMLANMWEFPTIEIVEEDNTSISDRLKAGIRHYLQQEICVKDKKFYCVHTFSHRKWDISFYDCEWLGGSDLPPASLWIERSGLNSLPWAGPHHKVAVQISKLGK